MVSCRTVQRFGISHLRHLGGRSSCARLREFKHTYTNRDRVITLLLLEGAEPREWDDSWKDKYAPDASDQFHAAGQLPVR